MNCSSNILIMVLQRYDSVNSAIPGQLFGFNFYAIAKRHFFSISHMDLQIDDAVSILSILCQVRMLC
jgi:hypothetical protein